MAELEHVNVTVSNIDKTTAWMKDVFDWHIRWDGIDMGGNGNTVHIGTDGSYLALYCPHRGTMPFVDGVAQVGSLNHIAVTVDDLDGVEAKVRAKEFHVINPEPYDPGRRFYFFDQDTIEFEVVTYG
ncbi:MAG: VOC family protein [Planktomarina sp.]